MEKEGFFTGYCRVLDESRMVCAVVDNGHLTEVDCCYETCVYAPGCTVAQSIRAFAQEHSPENRPPFA